MMFLPCRQNVGRRAHRTAVLSDGSWELRLVYNSWWHSRRPAWSLGPLVLQFTVCSTSPSPVSLWLVCLVWSTEAGASTWQSCTEAPQSCYKLSCTRFAPALFAGQPKAAAMWSSALLFQESSPCLKCRLCINWGCISRAASAMLMGSRLQNSPLLVKKAGAGVKMGLNALLRLVGDRFQGNCTETGCRLVMGLNPRQSQCHKLHLDPWKCGWKIPTTGWQERLCKTSKNSKAAWYEAKCLQRDLAQKKKKKRNRKRLATKCSTTDQVQASRSWKTRAAREWDCLPSYLGS